MEAETRTHQEWIRNYEYLQDHGRYGAHPLDLGRAVEMWAWITAQLNAPATVIDCSCGRGFLIKLLRDMGLVAEGTEASEYLIENVLKPSKLPVRRLFYSELGTLPAKNWDVVVSNDVLEHLFNEEEVRAALLELSRMAKRWLCVSIGLKQAARSMGGKFVFLHHVVRPLEWWVEEVGKVANVVKHYTYHCSGFIFAEPTEPPPPQ